MTGREKVYCLKMSFEEEMIYLVQARITEKAAPNNRVLPQKVSYVCRTSWILPNINKRKSPETVEFQGFSWWRQQNSNL